jgi:hypothetical protein
MQDLYDMRIKLDYIYTIKKCIVDIDNLHSNKDKDVEEQQSDKKQISEASTVVSTMSQPTPRTFACSSGYYEPAEETFKNERKEMKETETDAKVQAESQSLPHSDSTPSMNELIFSKALMRTMKSEGDRNGPSPNTLAYATIATGLRVELHPSDCVVQPTGAETPTTPKNTYRTIALKSSPSTPKG